MGMRTILSLLVIASPALGQLGPPPVPPENPITPEKALLGKALFWEDQLSASKTVSCGTCHLPAAGGSDPRTAGGLVHPGIDRIFGSEDDIGGSPSQIQTAADGTYVPEDDWGFELGIQVTLRRSMPMIMAAYAPETLWDGTPSSTFEDPISGQILIPTGGSLESQALHPLLLPIEMGHLTFEWEDVRERLGTVDPLRLAEDVPADLEQWIAGRGYRELFDDAFGSPHITPARIAFAIATYERTLVPDQTPYDAYLAGDGSALTPLELQGLAVFEQAGCALCHSGPELTNHAFEYLGVRPHMDDRGRFYATLDEDDLGRMRVPSLRNVELRAPYMHNGRIGSLMEVVEFFDRGGDFDEVNKSPLMVPLGLTSDQKNALVAFLGRPLTDLRVRDELPPFDRPQVYIETGREPEDLGGGVGPRMIAHEPPLVGNPSFTLAVDQAPPGATAILLIGGYVDGMTARLDPGAILIPAPPVHGDGWTSVSVAVPEDPALVGQTMELQWLLRLNGVATPSSVARVTWY